MKKYKGMCYTLSALMLCMGAFFTPMRALAKGDGADKTPPAISVELSGGMLHIEAEDEDSGVDAVYIGSRRVNYREGSPVEYDFTEFAGTEDKSVGIYAVDFAGNQSEVVEILNPDYEGTGQKTAITPDGQATVVDAATDEDGKEFYTFVTPEENVFYLVIDRERDSDNVYFLNAVTEEDLLGLAEEPGDGSGNADEESANTDSGGSMPESTGPQAMVCSCTEKCEAGRVDMSCPACVNDLNLCMGKETETAETEEREQATGQDKKGSGGTLIFVLMAVLAAGGIGYYFKIYKPKHELDDAEDLDDLLDNGDDAEVNEDDGDADRQETGAEETSGASGHGAGEEEKRDVTDDEEDLSVFDDYPEEEPEGE